MRYAGFWSRFVALVVDDVVFFVVLFGLRGVLSGSLQGAMVAAVLYPGFVAAYQVIAVGRWGKTLGKKAAGIEVVDLNGGKAGWRRAFLRECVWMVLAALSCASQLMALTRMSPALYASLSGRALTREIASLGPSWNRTVRISLTVWVFSELVVLLFNRKKRALHDFIAGTVVIYRKSASVSPLFRKGPLPAYDGVPPNIGVQRMSLRATADAASFGDGSAWRHD